MNHDLANRPVRVLGVDPGLGTTGYGCVSFDGQRCELIEAGTITTNASQPLSERLAELFASIGRCMDELQPDFIAIEQLYVHREHPQTAVKMAHARGCLLLAAAQRGIELQDLPATRIKKSLTGVGSANKQQIQAAIASRLGLRKPPAPDDVADALAAAICCAWSMAGNRLLEKAK